jgi:hypothetical protein
MCREDLSLNPTDSRTRRTEGKESNSKALGDLIKAYAGDKMKFSGPKSPTCVYLTSLRQGLDETGSARRNSLYPRIDIVVPGVGGGDERVGNVALLSSEE